MTITIIRSYSKLPPEARGGIVTLGNFDGMHLGHKALLEKVVNTAKSQNKPSVVITFYPHPGDYFSKKKSVPKLISFHEKVTLMEKWGIDYLLFIKFNQKIASMPAEVFVKEVLKNSLNVDHIILGDDFHFGYKRQGDIKLLQRLSEEYQYTLEAIPTQAYQADRISSTRIRNALKQANLALANQLLGRPFAVSGRVQYGDALGRQLGFPTINLAWVSPPAVSGIYTVVVHGIAQKPIPGVASSGIRPTINGSRPLLEVHLLDFNQIIYGKRVTIEFCQKLRDELTFENLTELQRQIAIDVKIAQAFFMGKK